MSSRAIDRKVSSGEWRRISPGVYRLASSTETWMQNVYAAYLWAHDAVVSGTTAARMFDLQVRLINEIELLSTRGGRRAPPGVKLRFARQLTSRDVASMAGLRVTTPTRTIIDLSSCLGPEDLEAVLDEALRRELTTVDRLLRRLEKFGKGKAGTPLLRKLLEERRADQRPVASLLQTKLGRLLRSSSLPNPAKEYEVWDGKEFIGRIDFAYPEFRVAIEADGYRFHSDKPAWRNDRVRNNDLARLGWRLLRFTWEDVTEQPDFVLATIRAVLEDQGYSECK